MRASIGALVAFAAWALAFHQLGGDLRQLVHLNGALIVFGGPVALLGATRKLDRLAEASQAAGVIAVVMGLVHVMENLDRPATVGPGVALALVAMIYALAATLVLERRRGALLPYALLAVTFLLLMVFAVRYALNQ